MKETQRRHSRYAAGRRNRRLAGTARRGRIRAKGTRIFWKRRALGAAAAVCGLLAVIVAVGYLGTEDGEIRRGVEAGGVELGGMTREEAREAIARRASTALGEIELVGGDEKIALSGEDLGVDVDATAEEAYAVGRRGGAFARLSDALGSYPGGAVRGAPMSNTTRGQRATPSRTRHASDATVWFGNGALDMQFENTTDGYVYLREYVADYGYIYAEVWGRPTGKEMEMNSRRVALTPDSATWVTYQKVTEDGETISMTAFKPAPVNP